MREFRPVKKKKKIRKIHRKRCDFKHENPIFIDKLF